MDVLPSSTESRPVLHQLTLLARLHRLLQYDSRCLFGCIRFCLGILVLFGRVLVLLKTSVQYLPKPVWSCAWNWWQTPRLKWTDSLRGYSDVFGKGHFSPKDTPAPPAGPPLWTARTPQGQCDPLQWLSNPRWSWHFAVSPPISQCKCNFMFTIK